MPAKQKQKAAVFAQMKNEFKDLRSDYGGMAAYDAWFDDPLNNAHLISVSTYQNWVPAFDAMLAESGGNNEKHSRFNRRLKG